MGYNFRDFIRKLSKHKLILLGEIHGTKEIPLHIKKIINSLIPYGIKNVLLEIPSSEQKYLDAFIRNGKHSDLFKIPFFQHNALSDGRNSKEYLSLISYLRNKNGINIFFIDTNKNAGTRDFKIYKNVKKIFSNNKELSVVITGNLHAYKNVFYFNNKIFKPFGYYLNNSLKNKVVSVNFIPNSGSFYNLCIKKVNKKPSISKIIITESKSSGYDFDYFIPKVSPCSFIQ